MSDVHYDYRDRVVVITGAATGIGAAAAHAFARAGAEVFIVDIDEEGGSGVAAAIEAAGGRGRYLRCDLTHPEEVDTVMERVGDRIDVLVNNAGGFWIQRTTEDLPLEEWHRVLDLNLTAVFLMSRAAIPLLRQSAFGRIINIGSLAGQTAMYRSSPPYAAAKAAVHALTRVLAYELAADGITVNALSPSAVLTDRILEVRGPEERAKTEQSIPLGRYGSPDDIAAWMLFLASQEAGYMTGQTIAVNGGRFMI